MPAPCEMCGVDNWVIGQYLASPIQLSRIDNQLTADFNLFQTSIPVLCGNCGNTKFFSLGMLGAGA